MFKGRAVPGPDAPGATQHECDCRVGCEHGFQDRNPFEQGMSCSLMRVDAFAGMPEHGLVVNDTIQIEVENDISAA